VRDFSCRQLIVIFQETILNGGVDWTQYSLPREATGYSPGRFSGSGRAIVSPPTHRWIPSAHEFGHTIAIKKEKIKNKEI
jgi:hypothetical protein